nr:hypothetical protein [uncultured Actinoplanes sp.]
MVTSVSAISEDSPVMMTDAPIHSNDLHEIRVLDRAIGFSRADIVCLVQDDDTIPRDAAWLDSALEHFDRHPRLAILGGFMGFESFDPDPARARRVWGGGFRFIHHVNIGPYFIRRQHYESLGGWEYSFSEPGEPGICFDNELCLRAWMNGYQVGYSFVPFKGAAGHYPADGGTVLSRTTSGSATRFGTPRPYSPVTADTLSGSTPSWTGRTRTLNPHHDDGTSARPDRRGRGFFPRFESSTGAVRGRPAPDDRPGGRALRSCADE